jgi:hypothetical protein
VTSYVWGFESGDSLFRNAGSSGLKTTQRYLNITDEELRKALTGVWERRRQLKAVGQ